VRIGGLKAFGAIVGEAVTETAFVVESKHVSLLTLETYQGACVGSNLQAILVGVVWTCVRKYVVGESVFALAVFTT
jgi:hypothetical protein